MPVTYESEKTGRVLTWCRDYIDFPPHFHESVEIVAPLCGGCTAYVDFSEYRLREGDVFVAFPGRIHSYSDEENILCYTFLFPSDICPSLGDQFVFNIPDCPVIRKEQGTEQLLDIMGEIYERSSRTGVYDRVIVRGYFTVLCATVLSMLKLSPVASADPSAERRIIDYCMENYRSPLTLDVLASELYISRHHISHLFSSKLKTGFNDFVNQLRIREACSLLEEGKSVTEAAFRSGFSSIRTFNRAFQKDRGMSPSEYVKKAKRQ